MKSPRNKHECPFRGAGGGCKLADCHKRRHKRQNLSLSLISFSQKVVTRTTPPCSPITTITTRSKAELVSSLSEDLADYRLVASAPGHISFIAAESYKKRFRKAELKEVVDEKRRLEEDRETLRRGHVYTKILDELHELWWPQLPQHIVWAFTCAGRKDLPSTFASWWLQWNETSPSTFPLPPSLRHFGPVKLNTRSRFIFDHSTHLESGFSQAVGEAWDILPDTVRQLMLFAWAAVQSVRIERNEVAHPNMANSTAKDILNSDFHNAFHNLHTAACDIVDYLF